MTAEATERVQPGEPWLFAPLNTLPQRSRWIMLAALVAATFCWCLSRCGDLLWAWGLPDVRFYLQIAQGQIGQVPEPFSARLLAPFLARSIAAAAHCDVLSAFKFVAYVSLLWSMLVVFWLLMRTAAPRWASALVAAVVFWPQLLGYAGLPDPLYTSLIATLLLFLELGWIYPAAALMLPLMVARESTSLTLLCLLVVGWRRLGWRACVLAVACAELGSLLVKHFRAGGLPNPEHLSGGLYMAGKLFANTVRSFGLMPWSNVYPYACPAPAWQVAVHLGTVRSIGLCSWDGSTPVALAWAFATGFGVLPVLALASLPRWRAFYDSSVLVRFCALYGAISVLLAPALGTWYPRLIGYGWPLMLVALPAVWGVHWKAQIGPGRSRAAALWVGALLFLHLVICNQTGYLPTHLRIGVVLALQAAACALLSVQRRVLSTA